MDPVATAVWETSVDVLFVAELLAKAMTGGHRQIDRARARARLFGVLLLSFTGVASELKKECHHTIEAPLYVFGQFLK